MNLGTTFLRAVWCSRRNAIRIELIQPKTIIAILVYKLYIRNLRADIWISRLIRCNEEARIVELEKENDKNNKEITL